MRPKRPKTPLYALLGLALLSYAAPLKNAQKTQGTTYTSSRVLMGPHFMIFACGIRYQVTTLNPVIIGFIASSAH